MRYITKKCGKCKYTIVFRRSASMPGTMGRPFIQCPKCKTWQIDKEYKEYIMWERKDYIIYFGANLLADIAITSLFVFILIAVVGTLGLDIDSNMLNITFTLATIIVFVLLLRSNYSIFLKERNTSDERVINDKDYLELLHSSHLITEEKYLEYKAKK